MAAKPEICESKMYSVKESFNLSCKVAIITGGAGLLGIKHAEAIAEMGGVPILLDINEEGLKEAEEQLNLRGHQKILTIVCDITSLESIQEAHNKVLREFGRVDILINNAAMNPKVESREMNFSRLENYPLDHWLKELNVGLTGAFLCSRVFGTYMAQQKKGVIINIASDLGLIAPNQSLYHQDGLSEDKQPVKPVTYSVIKHGLIGLTRYLATYWAKDGVRCNALAPGGIYNDQNPEFLIRIQELIPMQRMANKDEYKSSIVFLASDASAYMNGSVLIVDGGRTCW